METNQVGYARPSTTRYKNDLRLVAPSMASTLRKAIRLINLIAFCNVIFAMRITIMSAAKKNKPRSKSQGLLQAYKYF